MLQNGCTYRVNSICPSTRALWNTMTNCGVGGQLVSNMTKLSSIWQIRFEPMQCTALDFWFGGLVVKKISTKKTKACFHCSPLKTGQIKTCTGKNMKYRCSTSKQRLKRKINRCSKSERIRSVCECDLCLGMMLEDAVLCLNTVMFLSNRVVLFVCYSPSAFSLSLTAWGRYPPRSEFCQKFLPERAYLLL